MKRLKELIQKIVNTGKEDSFLETMKTNIENQSWISAYAPYEQVFQCLDKNAWNLLSAKAIEHYTKNKTSQEDFYNHLNEAFAYQYLIQQGYNNVKFLEDDKSKKKKKLSPDLSYQITEIQFYCEVKSIRISDNERNRSCSGESYDGSVYFLLGDKFFNKLKGHLEKAETQISMYGEGLIFIFIKAFDDFTHMYYDRYKEEFRTFLISYEVHEVYFKIGFNGEFIHKKRNGEIIFS